MNSSACPDAGDQRTIRWTQTEHACAVQQGSAVFGSVFIPELTRTHSERHIIGMLSVGGPKDSCGARVAASIMGRGELVEADDPLLPARKLEACKGSHCAEADDSRVVSQ